MNIKKRHIDWKPDLTRPTGKGGSKQHFEATDHDDHLVIETSNWGEGDLWLNGELVAHIDERESASRIFRDLKQLAKKIEAARTIIGDEAGDSDQL